MPEIIDTRKYIIVLIPKETRNGKRSRRTTKVDFSEIEGILRKEDRFRGRTSVEIQHRAFEI